MATWDVGSVSYAALTGASNASGQVAGKFWLGDIIVGQLNYERRRIAVVGINGYHIKACGSRGRSISGEVCYIGTSYGGVAQSIAIDRTTLENNLFNVTPPGGSLFENCELAEFLEGITFITAGGKYLRKAHVAVFQTD